MFANPIDQAGAGFAGHTNHGWLLGGSAGEQRLEPGSKLAIAQQLLTALRAEG
jgi:hypothetical protein